MISISIYADSIRALKLDYKKKKFKVKKALIYPLAEQDIVQGRIKDKENILKVLSLIKEDFNITESEDIFLNIPNGICHIENYNLENNIEDKEILFNKLSFVNKKELFLWDVLHFGNEYNVINPKTSELNKNNLLTFKNYSCISVEKELINEYVDLFDSLNMNVVSTEPISVSLVRYLKDETEQPFMIVDIEYDYTSFSIFSSKYGFFNFICSEIGSRELIQYQFDDDNNPISASVSKYNLEALAKKAILTLELYNQSTDCSLNLKQIIFPNNDYSYVVEKFSEIFPETNFFTAGKLIPYEYDENTIYSTINENEIGLFISNMALSLISKQPQKNIEDSLTTNLLTNEQKNNVFYRKIKNYLNKGMCSLLCLSSLYMVGSVGTNIFQLCKSSPDAEKVTSELKSKYEDVKKEQLSMEDNIVKLNLIAENKKNMTSVLDYVVANKPNDINLASLNFNYEGKKSTIECIASSSTSVNNFLQKLKEHHQLVNSQIVSSQSKNGIYAYQIVLNIN